MGSKDILGGKVCILLLPPHPYFMILMSFFNIFTTSLVAQLVKNLLAMQETQVRSLGQEDSLEEGTAIHFGLPAWRIPWTEEPGGLQSVGSHRVGCD